MNYYLKQYKNFVNGRYASEGVRMTAGIIMPAFVMAYFGDLAVGIVMSSGALCVAATDNPGPFHHRRNGMLVCNGLLFIVTIITGLVLKIPVLLATTLFLSCFLFSMLNVYGVRAASVGIASLLIMILNLQQSIAGNQVLIHAAYVLVGGIWYMLFSLILYRIRPYKLIQQVLGDYIQRIAEYLYTRADLYQKDTDYNNAYQQLMVKQASVQELQNLLSELLFKTRSIVKESTNTGRVLVMLYLDVTDLFESVMTAYHKYPALHEYFDETGILNDIRQIILLFAEELRDMGVAVKSGDTSYTNVKIEAIMKDARKHLQHLRRTFMGRDNIDGFVALGRIFDNLEDMAEKIQVLHHYTTYDRKIQRRKKVRYDDFVVKQELNVSTFLDNFTLRSNVFRHSLRVSVAVLVGYVISIPFHIGHSYWILLTIVVILKPGYSLTKKRNTDRLIGTFAGILIGIAILYFINNNQVLLAIMIVFMTGSYVFLRTNYFISVLLMSPFLVILFHLLDPNDFKKVLTDRVIDTSIGSVIAFFASFFLIPSWEHTTIIGYMTQMLEENKKYYRLIAPQFTRAAGGLPEGLHGRRKDVFVALANLSGAFNRMLSEPKQYQKEADKVHRFVVLSHTLISHIATLSYYLQSPVIHYRSPELEPVIADTLRYFDSAMDCLEQRKGCGEPPNKDALRNLVAQADALALQRRIEIERGELETETKGLLISVKSVIDQFSYIHSLSADISKVVRTMHF